MEFVMYFVAILFSFATSLGVGSSTLAIINFFVAISDGSIDQTERKMMGVVYIIMRISMIVLFFTLSLLTVYNTYHLGQTALTPLLCGQWLILLVLYANAILMTIRVMPSTFGPALQAGSWYTLGIIAALIPLGLASFSFIQFMSGYIVVLTVVVALVNSIMALLQSKK